MANSDSMRFAVVLSDVAGAKVKSYMPSNYSATVGDDGTVILHGFDNAGWTLDNYVLPRLASGNIVAVELIKKES